AREAYLDLCLAELGVGRWDEAVLIEAMRLRRERDEGIDEHFNGALASGKCPADLRIFLQSMSKKESITAVVTISIFRRLGVYFAKTGKWELAKRANDSAQRMQEEYGL